MEEKQLSEFGIYINLLRHIILKSSAYKNDGAHGKILMKLR
jgi:hypothetical protein